MKTSVAVGIVAVIVVAVGAWYLVTPHTAGAPGANTNAGLNGSPNQGNLGQPDNGTPQQPTDQGMADNGVQQPGADGVEGSVIGSNLALGTDGNAALGKYLIGYNGMTLYTYSKDTGTASTCYDTCATNWPPYIVGAEDNVKQVKLGVDASKVGTTIRTDGKIQVTYNGHPLYFYAKDRPNTSDTTGQGVGGVWFVVKP